MSFARFRVSGGPKAISERVLEDLRDHAIAAPGVGAPPEVQAGWVAGRHVLDTELDADAVVFGDQLVFGLRVDTNRLPAELRRAYRAMAFAEAESNGEKGGAARRGATRADADERSREALATGRFVRSRLLGVVWDVGRRLLLAPAFAETLSSVLCDHFRATFDASLEKLSSGGIASEWFSTAGRSRDYEDLSPSPFTEAPPAAEPEANRPLEVPTVPWSFPDRAARDFLGNEFLIWLWSRVELGDGMIETRRGAVGVAFDRALDMDCAWDVTGRQSLRATGPLRLPEARVALRHGKWPRKAGLVVAVGAEHWDLVLQGDRFLVTGVRVPRPETPPVSRRERVEERVRSLITLDETMVALFRAFLEERADAGWSRERTRIRAWIQDSASRSRGRRSVIPVPAPSGAPPPTVPT